MRQLLTRLAAQQPSKAKPCVVVGPELLAERSGRSDRLGRDSYQRKNVTDSYLCYLACPILWACLEVS